MRKKTPHTNQIQKKKNRKGGESNGRNEEKWGKRDVKRGVYKRGKEDVRNGTVAHFHTWHWTT